MKILYIYRDYMGRRKKYGEMMELCGHKVHYLKILEKKVKNQVFPRHIKKYSPDIVWIYTPYYISHKVISDETLDYLKTKGIPIAMYSSVDPETPYINVLDVWKKIDYLFIHYRPFCDFLRKNKLNAYYSPLGFYKDQYYKTISNKKYDISFMGTPQTQKKGNKIRDKRSEYLQSISNHKIAVYGNGFRGKLNNIPVYPFRGHDIQREVYSKTKINLDLPFLCAKKKIHPFYKGQIHFKNRFFEVPATGNFLLTVRCPEFLEVFPEDCVGYYDDNIESLKENVKKYLKDKELRKKMAKKAYKLVREKHTYLHRLQEIFRIIGKV